MKNMHKGDTMRIMIAVLCCSTVLTGCSVRNMVRVADCPDVRTITPPAGKAALVIAEPTRYENYDSSDNQNIASYLDGKFIGRTRNYGFFIATVEPGRHYVVADGENLETVLLDFKPGKTYYLEQERRMGYGLPRTKYVLVKGDRLSVDLNGNCACYAPDPNSAGRDLDEDRYTEAVAAYTKKNGTLPANRD